MKDAYFFLQMNILQASTLQKDTGLNVGTNNVPCHVKINADEFTLKKKKKFSLFI